MFLLHFFRLDVTYIYKYISKVDVALTFNTFMISVDLTNGQLTPNNNTPLLTQALSGKIVYAKENF